MDTNQQVLAALKKAGKPQKSAEVVQLSGLDKKMVDKALKDLKKQGLISSPKNCYYEPAR